MGSSIERRRGKRLRKALEPRFKPDISAELSGPWGCPEQVLPAGHLARVVKSDLEQFDVSELERKYSSQGRWGFHPRHVLGALVYGSLMGIHHSTKLAGALQTDMGARFVAGGHVISEGRLRAFRRENGAFFKNAQVQSVAMAVRAGLINTSELAIDSVRIRAHASTKAARTLKRSKQRLEQLSRVNLSLLSEAAQADHSAKVERHRLVVRACEQQARTNFVVTSPSAGLMKFPSGASAPGHRATVVASGVQERIVIDVLVDSDGNDVGKLGPAILRTRQTLVAAGVPLDAPMQVAGDAGYFTAVDLAFAATNRKWVDILIDEGSAAHRRSDQGTPQFGVDDFTRLEGGTLQCPAGRQMHGPYNDRGRERWHGQGCRTCALKKNCTNGEQRIVTIDTGFHELRDQMRARLAEEGARQRYNQRIATIEPVFSSLEDTMGFRRVSTRKPDAVYAEIMLKVLAYNIGRLIHRRRTVPIQLGINSAALPKAEDDG